MKKIGKKVTDLFYAVLMGIVILALWDVAIVVFKIPRFILPKPLEVINALIKYWPLSIKQNLLYTLTAIGTGYSITLVISLPLAFFIASSKWLEKTVYQVLVIIQIVPKVALAPLFIIWFGFGITSKIVMVFLNSFFSLLVDATTGFKSLNPRLVYVARTMTKSKWDFFWKMRFPSALPHIFTGIKISITTATVGAIIGEFVGSNQGLGYLLLKANSDLNTAYLLAVLIVLAILGILLYKIVEIIESLVLPWHVSRRDALIKGKSISV